MIWLIKFKGEMGVASSLNMDGSDAVYATGVVFANTAESATDVLQEYLRADHITLQANEVTAEQYKADCIKGTADEIAEIKQCALLVNENNPVKLANAISSEAYEL
jgi:hypothetical protein